MAAHPKRSKYPLRRRVRCLGPGPEHFFRSLDPTRVRICNRCQKRLAATTVREPRVVQVVKEWGMAWQR